MTSGSDWEQETVTSRQSQSGTPLGLALALAALAAVGAGIAIQQIMERRLSRSEVARLRFLRYLRERGRLES